MFAFVKKEKKESISNVCKHDRMSIEREVGEWIGKISFLAKQRVAS